MVHQEIYKGYGIEIDYDQFADNPVNNGNYSIVQFVQPGLIDYQKRQDTYFSDDDALLFQYRKWLKTGKAWSFTYRSYSMADGFYKHPTNEPANFKDIDGLIIFDDNYIEGVSLEDRKLYATQDLEEYTKWNNGEAYWVDILEYKTCNLGHDHGETIDGGGNIIDDLDNIIEEAKATIDRLVGDN